MYTYIHILPIEFIDNSKNKKKITKIPQNCKYVICGPWWRPFLIKKRPKIIFVSLQCVHLLRGSNPRKTIRKHSARVPGMKTFKIWFAVRTKSSIINPLRTWGRPRSQSSLCFTWSTWEPRGMLDNAFFGYYSIFPICLPPTTTSQRWMNIHPISFMIRPVMLEE